MAFKFTIEAKLAVLNTLAGTVGGVLSYYTDRGMLNLGTMASLIVGAAVLAGAAYLEQKAFKHQPFKWFFNHGAFVYILVWLVVNGLMATY